MLTFANVKLKQQIIIILEVMMKRITLTYDGLEYAAIEIEAYKIDKEVEDKNLMYTICDMEFWWDCLQNPCMLGDREANEIDAQIYYYCDSGFCDSEPTEEEVIEYFKRLDI